LPDGTKVIVKNERNREAMSTTPQVIWDSDITWDASKDDYSGPEYLRHAKPRGLSNPRFGQPMAEFQPAADAARQAEEEHQRISEHRDGIQHRLNQSEDCSSREALHDEDILGQNNHPWTHPK